ncbi:MAG: ferrous iron transporter B [Anaerolineae bacterium]|nr:MAG: ferrous iron transporter B [Anaerolineae bacterium]
MRFALIGQPNCGKSTLFNQVAGYRAETGNFPGTTVTYTESRVRVAGEVVEVVDLPGTYSLAGTNPAERETMRYLASRQVDVIINVVDASRLSAGLELTLELLALGRPMVIALNMMDEAARLGLEINGPGLEQELGVPVLPLIASKGRGVKPLFLRALRLAKSPDEVKVEKSIRGGSFALTDPAERHARARELVQRFVRSGERRLSWRDRLDDVLLHPLWGYLSLFLILFLFFEMVYGVGAALEGPLLAFFDGLTAGLGQRFGAGTLLSELVIGTMQGVSAGIAIVLPYLVPFLLGLGLLEDIGYLPRVAFLMDALMHRIGLHGKAVVPFILGYGCNVPAVMSTRTLEDPRERYLAAAVATLVPCAARLSVVFGLVAFYLGPVAALSLYLFNLFVIALTGRLLSRVMPEDLPGLILEIPPYRLPTLRIIVQKAWFRVREFVTEAWPLLIAGSAVLAALIYFRAAALLNVLVRPITWTLGLPSATGVPLIFGILRKELSLIMLGQALGSTNFDAVLTPVQMYTFAAFVMFYIPCLATLGALKRELGTRSLLSIAGLTVVVALLAASVARVAATLFVGGG